ncbi:MAG: ClpXP protease specificity-enhancing factor [Shewanella sp.]|nr:ClpXP protease specificity-enhancing factor [Shewanella sp.]MCF1430705.1 ClpXP protease specificity-enhancing factor [Shewanella sp.]MCF1437814.1 ClpXP protease specificity-enhancing factor [Shewanella sp.]MCF1458226.1 ClpXP protease specificity-enhancing factor [Shewanella sp.]
MANMTPQRPYLLRAYYEWLLDNDLTPHLVVDAHVDGTLVPQQYVKDGQIVLNLTPSAIGSLQMGNDFVEFDARFGGVPQQILLPLASIIAIYARENGAGVVFEMEEAYMTDQTIESEPEVMPEVEEPPVQETAPKKPHLTVVK